MVGYAIVQLTASESMSVSDELDNCKKRSMRDEVCSGPVDVAIEKRLLRFRLQDSSLTCSIIAMGQKQCECRLKKPFGFPA